MVEARHDVEGRFVATTKLNSQNKALLELLRANQGKLINAKQILKVTGWQQQTWKTYWA